MTEERKSTHQELSEPLLLGGQSGDGFRFTTEQLCDLFHPDNIKNYHSDGGKVSISLYNYWIQMGGPRGLSLGLKTSLKNGIEGRYGSNAKRLPKIRTLWELIMENFEDRILQILLLAATVALIVGIVQHGWRQGWVEGLSIFIAVIIIVSVTAGNNYMKEKQFQKLVSKAQEDFVAVYRGNTGETQTLPGQDIVVGDIIKIEGGMRLPADCILIEGTDVAADESGLTGEPEQVEKHHVTEANFEHNPNPFLYAKTLLVSGQGIALVGAVGVNSRSGMAEEKLNIEDEITPLQAKLETIANEIGKVGVYVAILTFIAMTVKLVINIIRSEDLILLSITTLNSIVTFVIIGITIIVVAVPEGLPLAVTISLAYSVMKMKLENNLVRKLDASETMGGANEICTDKTGTLTKNMMTVKAVYINDQIIEGRPAGFKNLHSSDLLTEGILFNCSARIERNEEKNIYEPRGNCTEQGIIRFLQDFGIAAHHIIRQKDDRILEIIPFNSMRKKACTALQHPDDSNLVRVFVKGAPEYVLANCDLYYDKDGKTQQLDEGKRQKIMSEVVTNEFAKKAYRTILIAHSDLSLTEYQRLKAANNDFKTEKDRLVLEKSLIMIGIMALQDPLRDEIIESVRLCHRAGINIRMVTGDNLDTAKAIAIEAGLVGKHEAEQQFVCMEGRQFRELCGGLKRLEDPGNRNLLREEIGNKAQFRQIKDRLKVLARSTPEDKYMLVTGLKELGSVVAVTGDGTNDAPALKKADVGFAMGITGTEVAKEASDIILLDDNFASIITAVKWGRNIYTNVRKFLQFQLTVNCVAMFIVFLGGVVVNDPPLTSVQMLWVNLIMDTCAALALATEPPAPELLEQKPYSRRDLIVTAVMWRNIIGQAIFQAAILIVILFAGKQLFGLEYAETDPLFILNADGSATPTQKTLHYTLLFNTFVFMQVFNEINSRKLGDKEYNVFSGFFNNFLFLGIIIGTIIVQVVLVQYGGQPIRCHPLTLNQHLICIGIGFVSLIQGFLIKAILPSSWFSKLQMKEDEMTDEQEKESFPSQFRKSFRQSKRKSGGAKDLNGSNKLD